MRMKILEPINLQTRIQYGWLGNFGANLIVTTRIQCCHTRPNWVIDIRESIPTPFTAQFWTTVDNTMKKKWSYEEWCMVTRDNYRGT